MKIDDDQVIEVEEKKGMRNRLSNFDKNKKISNDEIKSTKKVGNIGEKIDISGKVSNMKFINYDDNKFKYIIVFLLGFIVAFAGFYCFNDYLISKNGSVKLSEEDISSGINAIYDSVVYIENYEGKKIISSGTGFVYKKSEGKGYILTNMHVVKDSTYLKIVMANGKKVIAKYLGGDEYLDIACLSIDDKYVTKVAKFGKSSVLSLGSTLFTVGSPVGEEFRGTVTRGILSGKDRFVNVAVNGNMDDYVMKVIQTDAAMNPGNSGGPLCNVKGEVIGINSLKLVQNEIEGMGFAISIEDVIGHLESFEQGKVIKRPYLGVSIFNLNGENSLEYYGMDDEVKTQLDEGVVIKDIEKNSISYGKLERGDIVLKVNGVAIEDVAHFRYELFKNEVGDKVTITIERSGKVKDIVLFLKDSLKDKK